MTEILKNQENIRQQFDEYYHTTIVPILKKHETTRYKYLSAFWGLILLGLIFYPYIIHYVIYFASFNQESIDVGSIISVSGFIIILLSSPLLKYKSQVKPDILPIFAEFFGNIKYNYGQHTNKELLQKSMLFKPFQYIQGDDFFTGTYKNVKITLSEEKHYKITSMRKGTQREKTFSGMCIVLEMNKNFKGMTIGLEDHGILNKFYAIKNLQNVKLEDSKFEQYFEVYSDDQIEARYLLTTAFMERLIKLRNLYNGKNIQFCFMENKIILTIPTKHDMFEAQSFFHSNIDKKKINKVFEQFCTVFSIVEILKLNQHIGV